MKKTRLNVNDVAEILLNKINDFKAESELLRATIEELKNSKIELDNESLKKYNGVSHTIKSDLEDFTVAVTEQRKFVPKWIAKAVLFFALLFLLVGWFALHTYNKTAAPEKVEYNKMTEELNKANAKIKYYEDYVNYMANKNPTDHKYFIKTNPSINSY